jgi:hypothetical protein
MKANKLLSTLALFGTLFGGTLIGSSQAEEFVVNGLIDPIEIGPIFSLELVTVNTVAIPDDPDTSVDESVFTQVFVGKENPKLNGNLYFGTVDMLSAPAGNKVPKNDYTDTPHRAGNHYTETRLSIKNNVHNTVTVTLKVTGNLLTLTPPKSIKHPTSSVMHLLSASLELIDNAGGVTANREHIQNRNTTIDVLNDTAITLYTASNLAGAIVDSFKTLVFLDFLPEIIPHGTYGGAAVWTLTSI